MRLVRAIDRALDADDDTLRRDADLRWLRWQLDALYIREGMIRWAEQSTLFMPIRYRVKPNKENG